MGIYPLNFGHLWEYYYLREFFLSSILGASCSLPTLCTHVVDRRRVIKQTVVCKLKIVEWNTRNTVAIQEIQLNLNMQYKKYSNIVYLQQNEFLNASIMNCGSHGRAKWRRQLQQFSAALPADWWCWYCLESSVIVGFWRENHGELAWAREGHNEKHFSSFYLCWLNSTVSSLWFLQIYTFREQSQSKVHFLFHCPWIEVVLGILIGPLKSSPNGFGGFGLV